MPKFKCTASYTATEILDGLEIEAEDAEAACRLAIKRAMHTDPSQFATASNDWFADALPLDEGGELVDMDYCEAAQDGKINRLPTPAIPDDECVNAALMHLARARDWLKRAGARKATEKVRSALKSAEGAKRNIAAHKHRVPAAS